MKVEVSNSTDLDNEPISSQYGGTLSIEGRLNVAEHQELDSLRFQDFQKGFSTASEQAQIEGLEFFIQNKIASDEQAAELIKSLDAEQKANMGIFIGKCVEPCAFTKSFHQCWNSLPAENQTEFIDKFFLKNPEHFLMVSPFVPVADYFITENGYIYLPDPCNLGLRVKLRDEKSTPLLEKLNLDFNKAKALIENGLALDDWPNARSTLLYFLQKEPLFLVPYLSKIFDKGLLDKDTFTSSLKKFSYHTLSYSNLYQVAEESTQAKFEIARIKKIFDQNKDTTRISNINAYNRDIPLTLRAKLLDLEQTRNLRVSNHILGNFDLVKDILPKKTRDQIVTLLIDNDIPVFNHIRKLGYVEKDLHDFFKAHSELVNFPFFCTDLSDFIELVKSEMKQIAISKITQYFKEDCSASYTLKYVMQNLPKIFELFSQEDQSRITDLISKKNPLAWCHNLEFFLEKNPFSFGSLCRILVADPNALLSNYLPLKNTLEKLISSGRDLTTELGQLTQATKLCIEADPSLILSNKKLAELFSREQLRQMLLDAIKKPYDLDLRKAFINDENHAFLRSIGITTEDIKEAVKSDQKSFQLILFDEKFRYFENLRKLFDQKEFKDLISASITPKNIPYFCDHTKLVSLIIDQPELFNKLKLLAEESRQPLLLATICEALHEKSKSKQASQNEINRNNKRFSAMAEKLYLLCIDNPDIAFIKIVTKVLGPKLSDIVAANLSKHIEKYPRKIAIINSIYEKKIISLETAEKVIAEQFDIAMALGEEFEFSTPSTREILQTHPYLKCFTSDKTDKVKVTYTQILDNLKKYKYFEHYEKELKKIVKNEKKEYGELTLDDAYDINSEFKEIVEKILLLEFSPIAQKYASSIASFTIDQREEVLDLLIQVSLHKLDREIALPDQAELSYQQLIDILEPRITSKIAGTFKIDDYYLRSKFDYKPIFPSLEYLETCHKYGNQMTNLFREALCSYLIGDYKNWRMWGGLDNEGGAEYQFRFEQMKTRNLLPQNLTLAQYKIWTLDSCENSCEILEVQVDEICSGISQIINEAVKDQHVPSHLVSFDNAKEQYKQITRGMIDLTSSEKDLVAKLNLAEKNSAEFTELSSEMSKVKAELTKYRQENELNLKTLQAKIYLDALKKISSDDVSSKTITIDKQQVAFSKVFRTLNEVYRQQAPLFVNDIKRLENLLNDANQKLANGAKGIKSNIFLDDKIDFATYLTIGKYPVKTCQNFREEDYDNLNPGLLSYLSDPSVKIIKAYDQDGKIIARAVLRLLADKDGNPQLFIERVYSSIFNPQIHKVFVTFAKQKANSLGVDMYSNSLMGNIDEEAKANTKNLYSNGSRSLYIYSDAASGLCLEGLFSIVNAAQLN